MPIDPTIPLQLQFPSQSGLAANPLEMVDKFADIQNKLNTAKLFNQTMAAKKRAGQIMSGPGEMDQKIQMLQTDPIVAPFAGEIAGEIQGVQGAITQMKGAQQGQAQSGLDAFMKSLPAAMEDPSQLGPALDANLAAMPDGPAKTNAQQAMGLVKAGLLNGLPSDPTMAKDQFRQRLVGWMIGHDIGGDKIAAMLGGRTLLDVGGVQRPVLTPPPQGMPGEAPAGPSVIPDAAAIPNTLRPQYVTPTNLEGAPTPGTVGGATENRLQPITSTPGGASPAAGNALGGKAVPIVGQTTTGQAEASAQGPVVQQLEGDMNSRAAVVPTQLRALNQMESAMEKFQAGGFADWRTNFAKNVQGLKNIGMNIDQATLDKIANGSLSSSEFFISKIRPFMVRQLTADATGQGRTMLPEVQAYLDALNATTDPAAIKEFFDSARASLNLDADMAKKYIQYKRLIAKGDDSTQGMSLANFNAWYMDHGGEKFVGQTPTGQIKGIPQPNPQKTIDGQLYEKQGSKWMHLGPAPVGGTP